MVEGREGGRDEEGADGTVFFAAKWQRARAESEHLPLLPRRRAQENHRLLSSPKQKAHPPADTDRQSVAALPCPVSYFVSFPGAASPAPYSRLLPIQLHPFPLSPRRHGARASRFSILADGTCRAEGSVPPSLLTPPSAILCRVSADETTRARQTRKFETLFTDLIEEERHVPRSTWDKKILSFY